MGGPGKLSLWSSGSARMEFVTPSSQGFILPVLPPKGSLGKAPLAKVSESHRPRTLTQARIHFASHTAQGFILPVVPPKDSVCKAPLGCVGVCVGGVEVAGWLGGPASTPVLWPTMWPTIPHSTFTKVAKTTFFIKCSIFSAVGEHPDTQHDAFTIFVYCYLAVRII